MVRRSSAPDTLSRLIAEGADRTPEEIEQSAAEIEAPEDAESEPLDEDWEDSPAYQDY